MKIFGQPADYSEILQRVFWFSVATGVACTVVLAKASPAVQRLIESATAEADLGPVKSIKVLYVLIPAAIAVLSRIIKLHDRISDLLRIRFVFDTRCFLYPLCEGAGVPLTEDRKAQIGEKRQDAMYKTVYRFAGFKNPEIDDQLVRTAADQWGWFWVLVESTFLLLVSAIICICLWTWWYVLVLACAILLEMLLMLGQWRACVRSAEPQVSAILNDPERQNAIREYFESI